MEEIKKGYKQTDIGVIPEDWEIKELSELTTLMTNGFVGIATTHYSNNNSDRLYIQGFNVEENSFNFTGIKHITEEFHQRHLKSCLQEDDLLTIQTGNVGLTTIVPKKLVGSNCHALIITRFKKERFSPKFFSYYFNSFVGRNRLKEIETGSTMKHINVGNMCHFIVPLPPSKSEQTLIAAALSDVDDLIAALYKKITKKQQIKQGAMQQLLTGKKRLPGFSGKWVEKTIGQSLTIKHGKNQKDIEDSSGRYPILGTGGIMSFTNVPLYSKQSVLIGRKGTIDKPQFFDTPFWTVDTLFYSEIKDGYSAKFIFYKFNQIDWYAYNEASGVPSLNAKVIESIVITFPPNLAEQTAIAQVLTDMDHEIEKLQAERDKYKQIKAGMMQVLLTGKVRLAN